MRPPTKHTVSPEFKASMGARGIAGTHAGALCALSDLVERLNRSVAEGDMTEDQSQALGVAVRDHVLPGHWYLSQSSPDEFLAIYEVVSQVLWILDEAPEQVPFLLGEWEGS